MNPSREALAAAYVENARPKRFFERWVADPRFRAGIREDPRAALGRAGISVNPSSAAAFAAGAPPEAWPDLAGVFGLAAQKAEWVRRFYREETVPSDALFAAWRERQARRQRLELGPHFTETDLRAPFAFELTSGCSVGCWFCSFRPGPLSAAARFDPPAERAWREALEDLSGRFGPALGAAFLYWATEPFDNPDYERFCETFFDVTGVFPPTTTALPLKAPGRTRRLLDRSRERGCWINRFSILSTRMLDRVHEAFTAEELALVECLPMNEGSLFALANAGGFRERAESDGSLLPRHRERLRRAPWFAGDEETGGPGIYPIESNACVTGFLVNLPERRARLIAPCPSDGAHPLGYRTLGEETFDLGRALGARVAALVREHMPESLPQDLRVSLPPWARIRLTGGTLAVQGRFPGARVAESAVSGEGWEALVHGLASGPATPSDLARELEASRGIRGADTLSRLDRLFSLGLLDDGGG